MRLRNWWNLHAQCEHDHKHRRKPLPALTITHAVMMQQDGGALMNAARLLAIAIDRKDDKEETRLRIHIQSLALSVLHLVNDKEDYTDVTHPGFTEAERRGIASGEGDITEPPPHSKRP